VSPETFSVDAAKVDSDVNRVPGIGYHVCRKYRGLVPEALRGVLDVGSPTSTFCWPSAKAGRPYKKVRSVLEHRQTSLKVVLMTSFGYLGFRNVGGGRIESHQAVTAYSESCCSRHPTSSRPGATALFTESWTACGSHARAVLKIVRTNCGGSAKNQRRTRITMLYDPQDRTLHLASMPLRGAAMRGQSVIRTR